MASTRPLFEFAKMMSESSVLNFQPQISVQNGISAPSDPIKVRKDSNINTLFVVADDDDGNSIGTIDSISKINWIG